MLILLAAIVSQVELPGEVAREAYKSGPWFSDGGCVVFISYFMMGDGSAAIDKISAAQAKL